MSAGCTHCNFNQISTGYLAKYDTGMAFVVHSFCGGRGSRRVRNLSPSRSAPWHARMMINSLDVGKWVDYRIYLGRSQDNRTVVVRVRPVNACETRTAEVNNWVEWGESKCETSGTVFGMGHNNCKIYNLRSMLLTYMFVCQAEPTWHARKGVLAMFAFIP